MKNFQICTIVVEALTPLDRTSRIKLHKSNARSRLFCRIAKRSIAGNDNFLHFPRHASTNTENIDERIEQLL